MTTTLTPNYLYALGVGASFVVPFKKTFGESMDLRALVTACLESGNPDAVSWAHWIAERCMDEATRIEYSKFVRPDKPLTSDPDACEIRMLTHVARKNKTLTDNELLQHALKLIYKETT